MPLFITAAGNKRAILLSALLGYSNVGLRRRDYFIVADSHRSRQYLGCTLLLRIARKREFDVPESLSVASEFGRPARLYAHLDRRLFACTRFFGAAAVINEAFTELFSQAAGRRWSLREYALRCNCYIAL
jgi:hypothetical protein